MVLTALDAAAELEKEGLDVEVIDLRTLRHWIAGYPGEHQEDQSGVVYTKLRATGGIGGELAAIIGEESFECLMRRVVRVASLDTPVPYSPPLEDYYLPQVKDVLEAARSWRVLKKKRSLYLHFVLRTGLRV